ncbi:MAG: histidine--tRNA ligase [Candidatus Micrarchaeota archaeon]|nr:histidine--tRNA ligase [Candidatus Micrarchaeota archaeon]
MAEAQEARKFSGELLQPPRGMRDYPPAEAALRQRIVDAVRAEFERYGFEPLDTPALENWEILSSKYAGGEEIIKETYSLTDLGNRRLGLRFDLTVPLCRFLAANPRVPLPFKRFQIGAVWRDGPVKLGRYREFWQADADTVGAENGLADAEMVALACGVFQSLGLNAVVRVSNRKILDGVLECCGVEREKRLAAMLSIDKLEKIGENGVEKELIEERGLPIPVAKKLLAALSVDEGVSNGEKLARMAGSVADSREGRKGLKELEEVLGYCTALGAADRVVFSPSLARGLNYYTGTVFEVFLAGGGITSSVAAGGRYDELIGLFSGRRLPAVGISFGVDVVAEALKQARAPAPEGVAGGVCKVFMVPVNNPAECLPALQELRREGVAAAIDLMGRSVGKNMEYAAKQGIPFAAVVGEKELKAGKINLRNLETGEEKLVTAAEAARIVALARR